MSDLSTLASNFEQESKQQAENTRKRVQSALEAHERELTKCLSDEQKRIESAIRDQSRHLRRTALKSWMAVAIPVAITLLLAGAGSWTLGWHIQSQVAQISEHRETLDRIEEQIQLRRQALREINAETNGLGVLRTSGERYLVIPDRIEFETISGRRAIPLPEKEP